MNSLQSNNKPTLRKLIESKTFFKKKTHIKTPIPQFFLYIIFKGCLVPTNHLDNWEKNYIINWCKDLTVKEKLTAGSDRKNRRITNGITINS